MVGEEVLGLERRGHEELQLMVEDLEDELVSTSDARTDDVREKVDGGRTSGDDSQQIAEPQEPQFRQPACMQARGDVSQQTKLRTQGDLPSDEVALSKQEYQDTSNTGDTGTSQEERSGAVGLAAGASAILTEPLPLQEEVRYYMFKKP